MLCSTSGITGKRAEIRFAKGAGVVTVAPSRCRSELNQAVYQGRGEATREGDGATTSSACCGR